MLATTTIGDVIDAGSKISVCPVDFDYLCDNNDFARITSNYGGKATKDLIRSIGDEKLRNFIIEAIKLERHINSLPDDDEHYEEILDVMSQQHNLQITCREYHFSITKVKTTDQTPTKGFTARQHGLLAYFISETNGIYYDGETQNINHTDCIKILSKITGLSETTINGKIIPDYTKPSCLRDINIIADTIKDIYPNVHSTIMHYLEIYGH